MEWMNLYWKLQQSEESSGNGKNKTKNKDRETM